MSEKKSSTVRRAISPLLAFAVLSAAFLLNGCASGKVLSVDAKSDVGILNEEMDYGITVTVVVKNVGEDGTIMINPSLSCSEGEWERTQNLHFKAQEIKKLTYFFAEPTINATNCHYGVSVLPKASE